jgi:hypothetical protein
MRLCRLFSQSYRRFPIPLFASLFHRIASVGSPEALILFIVDRKRISRIRRRVSVILFPVG